MSQTYQERADYWQHHVDQHRASGLSGVQYREQAQLTYHCFIYWRRKLTRIAVDNRQPGDKAPAVSAFVAVRPVSSGQAVETAAADDQLQLVLPNGLVIRHIHDHNLDTVRALLERL